MISQCYLYMKHKLISMSRCGVFTQLYRLEPNGSMNVTEFDINEDESPEILDSELWEEFQEKYPKRSESAITTKQTNETTFPHQIHVHLAGFDQYNAHTDDYYRMNKLHILRDKEYFVEFWSTVSKATEPFMFYHSGLDNHWPKSEALLPQSMYTNENNLMYRVYCRNGNVLIEKVKIGLGEWKPEFSNF